jgi:hypothetical protein
VKNRPPDHPDPVTEAAGDSARAAAAPADPVTRALRDLPNASAGPTFTDAVLARATTATTRGGNATPSTQRRLAYPALLAGAAALGATLLLLRPTAPPPEPAAVATMEATTEVTTQVATVAAEVEQLQRLRQEQRDLAAEVESLRAPPRNPFLPVVYLGRSGDVDLVLDLAHFQSRSRTGGEGEPR